MSEQDNILLRALELIRSNWIHAMHILREAADQNPKDPRYQIAMGDAFASRKSFDKALQHYLIALSLDPSDQQVTALIANCYISQGEYRLALAYYQKIVNPTDDLMYNKAIAQAFLGKHEDCITTLLEILPRFPNHPFIYYLLVEQYYYKGDSETALMYIDQAKRQAGEHVQLYLLSALIYSDMKRYLLAYDQYKKADAMGTITNSDHLLNYAAAAHKSGLWKNALSIYERITEKFPYLSEGWAEIIKIHLEQENYLQAKRYLNLAKKKLDRPSSVLRLLQQRLDNMS
jgi:tetratricopeptide (TPR) repeat protein